jgi:hypothetical protein
LTRKQVDLVEPRLEPVFDEPFAKSANCSFVARRMAQEDPCPL